ncbi:stomatin-like protein 2, mitochondrial [Mya arenaria]|uniref:stomatin-like protein 2, mitochondrial n=1 Tax=Mya arenaria TaxID=6604 RepID=UPI0022E08EB2|nr:stomatin-like protein 2, mitochondrial [Mya arenaria]
MLRTVSRCSRTEILQRFAPLGLQQCRDYSERINHVIHFVPQQEAWVVERFGKFKRVLNPGFNLLVPVIDAISYVHSLKEMAIEVPEQHAITADNVTLKIDGVLYVRVRDPYKASYGVSDPEFAVTQLAQTTMRSEIGKINLDGVFKERETLNVLIVKSINVAAEAWGIDCLRYEIRNIDLPKAVREAMQMQVEAERKKRAAILQSEGVREADINVAEGKKRARVLNSEANRTEQVNEAFGEAEATIAKARANSLSVALVAKALSRNNGMNAVSMRVAESYVEAFSNLAKTTNTVLLPANTGDVSSMVTQAMTIYKKLSDSPNVENMNESDVDTFVKEELNKIVSDTSLDNPELDETIFKQDKRPGFSE